MSVIEFLARLETEEVQMEAIKYLAEIIACLVLWIGVPAMFTLIGGSFMRWVNPPPVDQAA